MMELMLIMKSWGLFLKRGKGNGKYKGKIRDFLESVEKTL